MSKKHEEKPFEKGEILEYIGKGFLGFDKKNKDMEFVEYTGISDASVRYKDFTMLVFKYELKRKSN